MTDKPSREDVTTAPKSSWLQRDEDDCRYPGDTEGVTWCEDKINDTDTEYVRADLLTAERTALERERLVSDKLEKALKLADIQYMGCGGNLNPEEIIAGMQRVIRNALAEIAAIRNEN